VETFDLIIIGGGIAGLGVAREAASQGHSTLLLEANTCAGATSNNTLRIIHGGFRYLQNFDLPRVIRSLNDQTALINEVPHFVKPLPCLMPLTRWGMKSRVPVTCAGLLYGGIMRAQRSPLPTPRVTSRATVARTVPALIGHAPYGALCWYDALMVEPQRIAQHLILRATEHGATIKQGARVLKVTRRNERFTLHTSAGQSYTSRSVVSTLGPWLSTVELPPEITPPRPAWCKGFNLIIKRQIDPTYGIGVESPDKRLFFIVPRGTGSAIGTWYLPHHNTEAPATVSEFEIAQFLHSFNKALPEAAVSKHDIIGVDVGVLPMREMTPRGPDLIPHEEVFSQDGFIEVMSTKYTTFRSQAQTVVREVRSFLESKKTLA
jgi:glycerol-3-phosphate dehydrogenase